jgi:hypothetical protein
MDGKVQSITTIFTVLQYVSRQQTQQFDYLWSPMLKVKTEKIKNKKRVPNTEYDTPRNDARTTRTDSNLHNSAKHNTEPDTRR